jgi:hypothetical protein
MPASFPASPIPSPLPASFVERLTLQKEPGAGDGKGLGVRERIVKRAAKELKDGM